MDSARHFLPVPTIKDLLVAMSINKLNTLHWHLVTRLSSPIPSFPRHWLERASRGLVHSNVG